MSASRPWWLSPWLSIRAQLALGAIFVAAAAPKILDPPAFAHMVYNYRLLPGAAVNAFALLLPWVELLSGLALLLGVWRRTAAGLTVLMLLMFVGALSVNLARKNPVNCGCFDPHAKDKPRAELLADMRWTIARDAGILLLAAQVMAANRRGRNVS
ncbi:MAG TPA: MauE/DoxX family redox-associated membrane protein [Thermoanaerobaculia bacterium]|nr:MauE/DoxX family redox-associated membrane protein [Thermoanaerobaculia bacterium]